jgi:hypothetical protein
VVTISSMEKGKQTLTEVADIKPPMQMADI